VIDPIKKFVWFILHFKNQKKANMLKILQSLYDWYFLQFLLNITASWILGCDIHHYSLASF